MSGIYLKNGDKTVGPYTEDEFKKLREDGELVKYTAIFRDPSKGWEHLAPPPPSGEAAPARRSPEPSARVTHSPTKLRKVAHGYDVLLHDYRQVVSGTMTQMTEFGCEVVCHGEVGPTFSKDHPIQLNILDPKSGESTQVLARLDRMGRSDGNWSYRLLWDQAPSLLVA